MKSSSVIEPLCELLAPKSKLWADVAKVDARPSDALWLAVIDGLAARRRLAYLDWKSDAVEVLQALKKVKGAPKIDEDAFFAAVIAEDAQAMEPLLTLLGATLVRAKVALLQLIHGADDMLLTTVALADVEVVMEHVRAIDFDGRGLPFHGVQRWDRPPTREERAVTAQKLAKLHAMLRLPHRGAG